MENNISDSDKTGEVHIEEYDKTDSFEAEEVGFDDIKSEDPDDIDYTDEIEAKKSKRSLTDIFQKQLPALANIFKRNEKKKAKEQTPKDTKETKSDEPKAKAKFKLTPIHILVIIGLVIFLFIGEEETEEVAKPLKPIQKVIPTKIEPVEIVTEPADEIAESPQETFEEPDQLDEPVETEPSTVMDDVDLDIDTSPRPVEPDPEPEVQVADPDINEDTETNDQVVDQEITPEVEVVEEVVNEQPNTPEEILPQEIIDPEMSSDMTKKLLENLQVKLKEEKVVQTEVEALRPMSAPSYDAVGSGLVYNCKGGHWACIETEEYSKCRQNYAWNKSESIPIECYPLAFLENDFDCGTVQQEKVNSVPELDFCK